jgi:hypothetical protein
MLRHLLPWRADTRGALATMPAQGIAEVEHVVPVPRGACPVSGNPLRGEARFRYQPAIRVAEVVSLHHLVQRAARAPAPGGNNVEGMAQWLSVQAQAALGVPVEVELVLTVRPGPQVYRVVARG